MNVRVECHSGHSGEEAPRAFTLGETRFAVLEVQDRWLEPACRYFKIRVPDGRRFILKHDSASDEWELAALVG